MRAKVDFFVRAKVDGFERTLTNKVKTEKRGVDHEAPITSSIAEGAMPRLLL